jgi:hypothetical protein
MHLGRHGVRKRLHGQNELADRTIAWERVGNDCGWGVWGCAAHLDRGDLRDQRKQARIIPRAVFAVVLPAAAGVHDCFVLLLPALVQAVDFVPKEHDQDFGLIPPVELPVGAMLGIFLVPFLP